MNASINSRLRRLETSHRPTLSGPVLALPSNGTEPPGSVELNWRRYCETGGHNGVVIYPKGAVIG